MKSASSYGWMGVGGMGGGSGKLPLDPNRVTFLLISNHCVTDRSPAVEPGLIPILCEVSLALTQPLK